MTAERAVGDAMTPLAMTLAIMRFNCDEAEREIAKGEERDRKRLVLESKEHTRARGVPSPDE